MASEARAEELGVKFLFRFYFFLFLSFSFSFCSQLTKSIKTFKRASFRQFKKSPGCSGLCSRIHDSFEVLPRCRNISDRRSSARGGAPTAHRPSCAFKHRHPRASGVQQFGIFALAMHSSTLCDVSSFSGKRGTIDIRARPPRGNMSTCWIFRGGESANHKIPELGISN